MLFLIMFYYYLYCILLCFIVYYPTPFPQAFGTLAPMPQCQLMLPVPEVPLAGVWGSLPLSSRMYLCIMYALLQQSYVSMFLCMYLCRYQCDRSKGCVFIDFQGVVLPFSFWSPPGYNYYHYFFSSHCHQRQSQREEVPSLFLVIDSDYLTSALGEL